jgi:hypothetical protein
LWKTLDAVGCVSTATPFCAHLMVHGRIELEDNAAELAATG